MNAAACGRRRFAGDFHRITWRWAGEQAMRTTANRAVTGKSAYRGGTLYLRRHGGYHYSACWPRDARRNRWTIMPFCINGSA
jgi:hypothetical protein